MCVDFDLLDFLNLLLLYVTATFFFFFFWVEKGISLKLNSKHRLSTLPVTIQPMAICL